MGWVRDAFETLTRPPPASEKRVPASDNQRRYVLSELAGSGSYMIAMGHHVDGPFDESAFRKAAAALVDRHEALRTRFTVTEGRVDALVATSAVFQCHVCTLPEADLGAFRTWALPLVFSDVDPRKPGALIRFLAADLGGSWRFTIAAHHATTDGFSRGVMTKELLKLYAGETLAPAGSYYDHAHPSHGCAEITAAEEARIAALPDPARLVADGRSTPGATEGRMTEQAFDGLPKQLRAVAKSIGTTKFGLLSAVYALGLHGFSGAHRVSSFFQTEGRKALGASNAVIGPFSNMLPLDLSVDPEADFAGFARDIAGQTREMIALETGDILNGVLAAQKAPTVSINMFPPAARIVAGGLSVGPREFLDRRTEFDLNLVWSEDRGVLTARAFHDCAQLSTERVELFLEFQSRLIAAALENPERPCREILDTARAGHASVMAQETTEPAPGTRLHTRFFQHALEDPDAPAIVTSRAAITYGQLSERALRLLGGLQRAGTGEGDCVAILADRHPDLITAMLAVSASGAAFAVVDASYPPARIGRMLQRLGVRDLIEAGAKTGGDFGTELRRIVSADVAGEPVDGPPRNVAYHQFTSGTTGEPKLVSHPDQTLQRFIDWQVDVLDPGAPIVTAMMAGLSHDPTLRDVFLPLSHRGAVAVPEASEMADPHALRALLRRAGCNVVRFSPATARLVTAGMPDGERLADLRAIFWGGERLPHSAVDQWLELAPDARQFNVFGTTETPQAFLIHEVTAGAEPGREIPIGHCLPWTGARLVADDGQAVSRGEVGEIVADLADPVVGVDGRSDAGAPGAGRRHYTGDLGYQRADGAICFAGRKDRQLKVNGFRVEPGDVEAVAESADGVQQARLLFADERLLLFLQTGGVPVTENAIRAVLSRHLPAYMWPARMEFIDRFPATPNGKVDTDALLCLADTVQTSTGVTTLSDPSGTLEQEVASVYCRHSGRSQASREQSLSDLGADSLSTIEARLDLEALGLKLPDNWPWMTIRELAANRQPQAGQGTARSPLFAQSRIETFILIRSLAILSVVAFHTGVKLTAGASIVLFVLAGFSFARLQLPAVLKDDHAGRVFALLVRLLIPLVPISLVYFGKHVVLDNDHHLSTILPYRNLAEYGEFIVRGDAAHLLKMEWLWFLHVYLQAFLMIAVALSFPVVRRRLAGNLWQALVALYIGSEVIGVLTIFMASLQHGDFWQMSFLLRGSPTTILPFLAIGAVAALADTPGRRALCMVLSLVHLGVSYTSYNSHAEFWWVIALALCMFLPYVTLPRTVAAIVVLLAAHSLMIYLTHPAAGWLFASLVGGETSKLASILFQLCFGVAFGVTMRPVISRLGVSRLAETNITFGARRQKRGYSNT